MVIALQASMIKLKNCVPFYSLVLFLTLLLYADCLPAYQQTICEHYNPEECEKDVTYCNSTTVCETPDSGKRSHCYAFLTNTSGVLKIYKKGCWLDDSNCYNTSKCVATDQGKGNFYCCCEGTMCNANITVSSVPYRPLSKGEQYLVRQVDRAIVKTLLSSLLPLLGIAVVVILFFLLWRCRQSDYIDQFDSSRDKPLLPSSSPSPSPEVGLRNVMLLEVKARGRFGLVHKAKMGNELVAVKVFPLHDRKSWEVERDVYRMPHINNHENVLRFITAEKRGSGLDAEFWLITEYHYRGSLHDHLKGNTMDWNEARRIIISVTRGLVFLHSNIPHSELLPEKPSIAHRDLKSRNILLKDDLTACIADFGLALVLSSQLDSLPGQVGTRRYMAPEVLDGSVMFSPIFMLKIDIYAFALILWEIASRCTASGSDMLKEYAMPFQEEAGDHPSLERMQDVVVSRKVRPAVPLSWYQNENTEVLCRTVEDCWDQDPEARLTAECILERFNRTSVYVSSDSSNHLPLLSKDQPSTLVSSIDDLSVLHELCL